MLAKLVVLQQLSTFFPLICNSAVILPLKVNKCRIHYSADLIFPLLNVKKHSPDPDEV